MPTMQSFKKIILFRQLKRITRDKDQKIDMDNKSLDEADGGLWIFLTFAVFAMGIFLLFYRLGLAPLGKAEGRIAEVVREMLIKRDFLHPTCLWVPYVTKPLVPYWFVIGITKLRGSLDEFTLRLPSAIGASFALMATYFLGGKIFSRQAALLATGILGTCLGFIQWGRCASPDMLNLAAIIVAIAWYWHWRQEPRPWTVFVFGCLVALAGHMKGMVGIVITLMVVAIEILLNRRLKGLMRPVVLVSLGAGLCLYLIPFLLSNWDNGAVGYNWLSTAFHETVTRAIKPFDHRGSPFMYLEFVPIWTLPWTPLFLAMLFLLFRRFPKQTTDTKWLLLSLIAIFGMFTLAGSRRSYYILPILPFCALITGVIIEKGILTRRQTRSALRIQTWFFLLFSSLLILASGWGLLSKDVPFTKEFIVVVLAHGLVILACATAAIFWLQRDKKRLTGLAMLTLSTAFFTMAGISGVEKPLLDKAATEKTFLKHVRQVLLKEQRFTPAYFKLGTRARTRLSFYLHQDKPVKNFVDTSSVKDALSTRGDWLFILSREDKAMLMGSLSLEPHIKAEEILTERSLPWEGWPDRQEKERQDKLLCIKVSKKLDTRDGHDHTNRAP